MTFKSAAIKILEKSDSALSAKEITDQAIHEELIETIGSTPEASMGAAIYTDIKNNKNSPFIKMGKGKFKLRSNKKDDNYSAEEIIESHNANIVEKLKRKLHEMDPFLFEQLIGDLLTAIGYEDVIVTKRSADGGIDVNAKLRAHGLTDVNTIVQVKRYKNNIQDKVVRELRGSAEVDQRGLIITTSDFTNPAKKEAQAPKKMPVSLVNGEKLLFLLLKYEIGINKEHKEVYSFDAEYFNSLELPEKAISANQKSLSIWPLPGGIFNYYQALIEITEKMKIDKNKKNIIDWFKTHFENVESERTIQGYLNVVRTIGLSSHNGNEILLTTNGKEFINNPSKGYLFNLIQERIFGFTEIIDFL